MALLKPVHIQRIAPPAKSKNAVVTAGVSLVKAITKVAVDRRIVLPEIEAERLAICGQCSHWKADGNAGLGKCDLCYCTRFKHKFAALRCPDNPPRWIEA